RPASAPHDATAPARESDPDCSPWSTVTSPARSPARGATNLVASARASESAPPEQATSTRAPSRNPVSARRTATRQAATAGASAAIARSGSAVHAGDPGVRVTQLGHVRQGERRVPDPVEAGHADPVHDRVHKLATLRVLPQFDVDAQQ